MDEGVIIQVENENREITITVCDLNKIKRHSHDMGIAEAKGHDKPSKKTLKMFESMQKEITQIKVDVAETKKDIGYIRELLDKLADKISKDDDKCAKCKEDFAKNDELNSVSEKIERESSENSKWRNRFIIAILVLAFVVVAVASDKVQLLTVLANFF